MYLFTSLPSILVLICWKYLTLSKSFPVQIFKTEMSRTYKLTKAFHTQMSLNTIKNIARVFNNTEQIEFGPSISLGLHWKHHFQLWAPFPDTVIDFFGNIVVCKIRSVYMPEIKQLLKLFWNGEIFNLYKFWWLTKSAFAADFCLKLMRKFVHQVCNLWFISFPIQFHECLKKKLN